MGADTQIYHRYLNCGQLAVSCCVKLYSKLVLEPKESNNKETPARCDQDDVTKQKLRGASSNALFFASVFKSACLCVIAEKMRCCKTYTHSLFLRLELRCPTNGSVGRLYSRRQRSELWFLLDCQPPHGGMRMNSIRASLPGYVLISEIHMELDYS